MKIKAGQIVASRRIEMVEIDCPPLAEGQILVKQRVAAICGSDVPYFLDAADSPMVYGRRAPHAPGLSLHECIGIVADSRSSRFREGDLVLALPGAAHSGLAEYFLANAAQAVHVPRDGRGATGDFREELVLAQPLGTLIHAVTKLGHVINQTAVVVGQGPIGLLWTGLLTRLGVRHLIATDLLPERLEVSRRMGATSVCEPDALEECVMAATDGALADLVVEAVGEEASFVLCGQALRRNGTLLAFGVPHQSEYRVPFSQLFLKEARIICSIGPDVQTDFPIAVDMIAQRRIDVTPLITHRFPFERAQEAFDMFADRRDGVIKALLQF
jgi:threonine dehydrogenase-like Zn-dependent dehydrogenase